MAIVHFFRENTRGAYINIFKIISLNKLNLRNYLKYKLKKQVKTQSLYDEANKTLCALFKIKDTDL